MKISVLISAYNAEAYIARTIESVKAQTFAPSEIIVLNDGSQDATGEILGGISGIRFINAEHRGISASRNHLIREAAGEWIAFLDADDLWEPEKLEKQAAYLREHPECEILFGEMDTFLDSSAVDPTPRQKELVTAKYPYLLGCSLIHRSLFARFGTFKETLAHGEDTDWLMRLLGSGVQFHKLPEVLSHYRIHDHNTMLSADMSRGTYLRMIAAAARNRIKVPETERLSVIIPAYNAEKYLNEAVDSVRLQELPQGFSIHEILVIDDGSEDATAAIAENLPGVTLIRAGHNCAAAARNAGIRAAHGSMILFLDADDVLRDGALKALCEPFAARKGLAASFGMAQDFISPDLDENEKKNLTIRKEPYGGFLSGCVLVRKSVCAPEDTGFFREELKSGETVDWLLRFREKHGSSMDFVRISTVTAGRRIHLSNTGRLHALQERANYASILRQKLKNRSKGNGEVLGK